MSNYLSLEKKKITTTTFRQMKMAGEKISMLTAYDYTTASILDDAGIDAVLIGDSAANVMAGYTTTVPMKFRSDDYVFSFRGTRSASSFGGLRYAFRYIYKPGGRRP